MFKTRVLFSKTGRAVWISHLDLMHTLQRAFTRAGVIICHSEGFNPHPQMSIALPLSVGMESICEVLDIKTETKFSKNEINSVLPEGLEIIDVYQSDRKPSEIKWIKINGFYEIVDYSLLNEFYSSDSIVISKKTKRGISDIDIKPLINDIIFEKDSMSAYISAQNPTLNPNNIIDALAQLSPSLVPQNVKFRRVGIFDSEFKEFR